MPRPSRDLANYPPFERWTALYRLPGPGPARWWCRCACGTEKPVDASSLLGGRSRSCGCLHDEYLRTRERPAAFRRKRVDRAGKRFGRLVARLPTMIGGRTGWLCDCDCGAKGVPVLTSNLRGKKPNTTSCGCVRSENAELLSETYNVPSLPAFCRRCGKPFLSLANGKHHFCSDHCAHRYSTETRWPKRKHYCPVCGTPFLGRAERVYDTERCRRTAGNQARHVRIHGDPALQAAALQTELLQRMTAQGDNDDATRPSQ